MSLTHVTSNVRPSVLVSNSNKLKTPERLCVKQWYCVD